MGNEEEFDKINDEIKLSYNLELKGDFYSLNYFGFFLDSDDEDLGETKNYDEIKE